MQKRELLLSLIAGDAPVDYTPAAFFLHFGPQYQAGQAAIDRYLQFFRHTGMNFVKVQFERASRRSASYAGRKRWRPIP